jgi:hypothetical protein
MKILVCVLCSTERTGWLNPWLCSSLLTLQRDPRFSVTVEMIGDDFRPIQHARNACVWKARQMGADVCIQMDNDNVPPSDFGDILNEAISTNKHVVALGYGAWLPEGPALLSCHDNGPKDGNFRITGVGGGGCLIISSEVWRVIEHGPWFRWLTNDDELQTRKMGEDYYFCEMVQAHGLKVWTHKRLAAHLKTRDATSAIQALQGRQ